jgi:excisionase family DNA binding protein
MAGEEVGLPEDIHDYLISLQEMEIQIQRLALDGDLPEFSGMTSTVTVDDHLEGPKEIRTDKEYLTVEEVSQLTSKQPQTIYNLVSQGNVPHSKGSQLRFKRTEIIEWLAGSPKKKILISCSSI